MKRQRLTPSERQTARRNVRRAQNLCRDCGEPAALVWPRGGVGAVRTASQCEKHLEAGRASQKRHREGRKAQPELGTVDDQPVRDISYNADGTFNIHTETGVFEGCQITGISFEDAEEPKP